MSKMSDLHIEICEHYQTDVLTDKQIQDYMLEKLIKEIHADPERVHEIVVAHAMDQLGV